MGGLLEVTWGMGKPTLPQAEPGFSIWLLALSLAPLFAAAAMVSAVQVIAISDSSAFPQVFTIAISSLMLMVALIGFFCVSRRKRRRGGPGLYKASAIRNGNEQALTFFTAIVVPVISLAVSNGVQAFACFWVIVAMLVPLLVRTGACFWNPVLVVYGYNLYEATLSDIDVDVRLVSNREIAAGDAFELVRINGRYFYAR